MRKRLISLDSTDALICRTVGVVWAAKCSHRENQRRDGVKVVLSDAQLTNVLAVFARVCHVKLKPHVSTHTFTCVRWTALKQSREWPQLPRLLIVQIQNHKAIIDSQTHTHCCNHPPVVCVWNFNSLYLLWKPQRQTKTLILSPRTDPAGFSPSASEG